MSIGAGIALIVIGAILAFAVDLPNDFVDFTTIGYIMIGAGVIVFIIGLVLLVRRRQVDTVTRTEGVGGAQVTRSTTRSSNDDLV